VPGNHPQPVTSPTGDTEQASLPFSALTGMLLAASLAPLGSTMIAVALPDIGRDVNVEAGDLTQWLVSSYLIASIALQSPGGKLGDRIGHGRSLVVGLSLVAAGAVLGLLVSDVRALGTARILMASGGAATVPATMAILRNQTAVDRRARVFGLFGACMGLAAAIGPLVGGELTERFGWRAVFAANLPVVALSLLLVFMSRAMYARAIAGRQPPADWLGSGLLAVGLALVVVALQMSGATAWWFGGLGAICLIALPYWERRVASPVVDFSLLARGPFFGGASIIALQNMAMYPLLFQLPVFFDRVRHVTARTVGQALLALTAAMVISSIAGGRLTERIGPRAQALTGSLIALVGLWWFADFASVEASADVIPGMVLIGIGIGMTSPPAQAASMSAVRREQAGMAAGVVSTMRYMGGVAGTTALGVLLVDSSSPSSHQRLVPVYAGALLLASALSLLLPGRAKVDVSNDKRVETL
jgi:MFS family permease